MELIDLQKLPPSQREVQKLEEEEEEAWIMRLNTMEKIFEQLNMGLKFSVMVLVSHKDMNVFTDLLPVLDFVLEV